MSAPTLDPVSGVLAVLEDGSATGTYKLGYFLPFSTLPRLWKSQENWVLTASLRSSSNFIGITLGITARSL